MDLGAVRDETQDDPLGFRGVRGPEHGDAVRFEGGGGPLHAGVVGQRCANRRLIDRSRSGRSSVIIERFLPGLLRCYTCNCKYPTPVGCRCKYLRKTDVADLLDRLVADALPGRRGRRPGAPCCRPTPRSMRQLATDLDAGDRPALGDFDVLAQLAARRRRAAHDGAGGPGVQLTVGHDAPGRPAGRGRPRSARQRRRGRAGRRGRLTDAGVARLTETAPVHVRGVAKLFVAQLDDQELADARACPGQGHPRLHLRLILV